MKTALLKATPSSYVIKLVKT